MRLRGRLWLLVVVVLAASVLVPVVGAPPVSAAPSVLVSNINQVDASYWSAQTSPRGQGFNTGSEAGGYTVTSVEAYITSGISAEQTKPVRAELWADDSNLPDHRIAELTVPSSLPAGVAEFKASPPVDLEPDSKYYLVVYTVDTNTDLRLRTTLSNSVDRGGLDGWTVDGNCVINVGTGSTPSGGTWQGCPGSASLEVRVNGFVGTLTSVDLVGLSAESSTDGSSFTDLLLLPAFLDLSVSEYTATVPNEVSHVRLTPTAGNPQKATLKVGRTGSTLSPIASGAASEAFALDVGDNEITINVEDAAANQVNSITVTITRRPPVHFVGPYLDLGFSSADSLSTGFADGQGDWGSAVAVGDDGSVVVAGWTGGTSSTDGNSDFAVARYRDGVLDPTFGTDGKVTTPVSASFGDRAFAVAVQPDGKVVAAGEAWVDEGGDSEHDFALVRYNADGTLDTSFGGDGIVTTAVSGSWGDRAYAVSVLPDNKIVAAGHVYVDGDRKHDFALVRYNDDGSLDTSFGDGGIVTTRFGDSNDAAQHARAMAVAPDGKIVVAGYANRTGTNDDFLVARYNRDGSLDTGFGGGDGWLHVTVRPGAGNDRAEAVAIQPDGKILLAGSSHNGTDDDFALVRVSPTGHQDAGFGSGGIVTTGFGSGADRAYGIVVAAGGKIVLAGSSHNGTDDDFAAARYTPGGALDTTFSSDGKATIGLSGGDAARAVAVDAAGNVLLAGHRGGDGTGADFALAALDADGNRLAAFDTAGWTTAGLADGSDAAARAVAVDGDGRIVVAGAKAVSSPNLVLARFGADGALDTSFGTSGTTVDSFDLATSSWATAVAVAPDGKIVVAGYNDDLDFAVNRYNHTVFPGKIDAGFGDDGRASHDFGGDDYAEAVAVQADGKIVVAGSTNAAAGGGHFAAVRFDTDGSLDTSFGTSGEVISRAGGSVARAEAVAIQPDGRIVLAGRTTGASPAFAVLRLNADGSVDDSFGGSEGVTTDFAGSADAAFDIAVQRDGRIVAVGKTDILTDTVFALARYMPDGTLDAGFGTGGTVTGPIGQADSVAVQRDGKIVAVGRAHDPFADEGFRDRLVVARYMPDGTPDVGFGDGGSFTHQMRHGNGANFAAALHGDRIIVAATAHDSDGDHLAVLGVDPGEVVGTDAYLTGLTVKLGRSATQFGSAVALAPAFDPATTRYTAVARTDSTHAFLEPTLSDPAATVYVTSVSPLAVGENVINMRVVAEDGATTRDYTVTVWRPPAGSVWSSTLTPARSASNAAWVGCFDTAGCRSQLSGGNSFFTHGGVLHNFDHILDDDSGGGMFEVTLSQAASTALQAMKFCVGTTGYSIGGHSDYWVRESGVDVGFVPGVPVYLSIGPSCGDTSLLNPELTLASNTDEALRPGSIAGISADKTRLQAFQTGDWEKGYELSAVAVRFAANIDEAGRDSIKAQVWSHDNNLPAAKLYDLVVPAHPIRKGTVRFDAPDGAVLEANKTYWLAFHGQTGTGLELTNSSAEAGASGWTLSNNYFTSTTAPDDAPPFGGWTVIGCCTWRMRLLGSEVGTASDNADLATLTAAGSTSAGGTFTGFSLTHDTATGAYSATVGNEVTHVKLTPTVADTGLATVKVGPRGQTLADVADGAASAALALEVGDNHLTVRVAAEDSRVTKDYTVTITREPPVSADLSALTVRRSADGTSFSPLTGADVLVPAFDAATAGYRATVGNATTHVQVTPTVSHSASTVKVGKAGGTLAPVASGSPSAAIALDVGDNAITVEVTAADSTVKNYTVTVRRVTTGTEWHATLVPESASIGGTQYVGCSTSASCNSLLTDNDFTVGSANMLTRVADYASSFEVVFESDPSAELQALKFCAGDTALAIGSSLQLLDSSGAQGWAAGVPVSLSIGSSCAVPGALSALTAAGSTDGSSFTALSGASALVPAFAAGTTGYRATVGNATTHVQLTPTAAGSAATVKVGPSGGTLSPVTSGSPSAAIALEVGDNAITVEVTAADSSTKTYTVTVRRVPSGSVWHATLVPEAFSAQGGFPAVGCQTGRAPCTGPRLTEAEISHRGEMYQLVDVVDFDVGSFHVNLHSSNTPSYELAALSFCVGDDPFDIGAVTASLVLYTGDIGFTDGVPVSLSIGVSCVQEAALSDGPTGLELVSGDGQLAASWTAPSYTPTGYDVHYTSLITVAGNAAVQTGASATAATGWVDAGHTGTTAEQSISGLDNGTVYWVRVRAVSAAGDSAWAHRAGTPADPAPAGPVFVPAGGATVTDAGTNITLTFAEAIKADASAADFDDSTIDAIVTLKATDSSGTDIGFDATIDSAKRVVTVDPTSDLTGGVVYVAVSDAWYDADGNKGSTAESTFTVAPAGVATPVFDPAGGATVTDAGTNITLTFAEAIKADASATDFTDSTIDAIVTLKATDSSGDDIGFDATIDSAKKVVTIDPTSALPAGVVYVAVSDAWYDADGNQGAAASAAFTVKPLMGFRNYTDVITEAEPEEFEVRLSAALAVDTIVNIEVVAAKPASRRALPNADFKLSATTLTFAAGETTKSFEVDPLADETTEGDESFFLRLAAPSGTAPYEVRESFGDSLYTEIELVILDDSTDPGLSIKASNVVEGDSGTSSNVVSLVLGSAAPVGGTEVTLSAGGTATEGTDFTLSAKTVTIAEGDLSASVRLVALDDDLDDDGETVVLNASSTNPAFTADEVTVYIVDTDPPAASKPQNVAAAPGFGTLTVTWEVPTAETGNDHLNYDVYVGSRKTGSGDNLRDPGNSNKLTSPQELARSYTLTGLDSVSYDVGVWIRYWGVADKVVPIMLETLSLISPTAVVTSTPLHVAPSGLMASGDGELTVRWDEPSGTVTGYDVQYKAATATAWTDVTDTDTSTSVTIDNLINGDDYNVRVRAVNAAGNGAWATITATPTGASTPTITLTAGASSVAEGGTVTVTATLSAAAPTGGVTVALGRRASGSTAAEGDFSVSAITVSAGATSGTAQLTATDDRVDEDDETLVLRGTATGHTAGSATVTITDNDTAGVTVNPTARTVAVGETTTYEVKLNSQPTANVVITPASSGTAKATVSGALTFTDSNWATAQEVTITGVAAGTGLTVTHAVASTDPKYPASLAIAAVGLTVTGAAAPGVPTVSLSASPNPVRPGTAGQVWHERRATVTVTATLSRPLDRVVVIPVTTTRTTSEQGDHGLIDKIVIGAGQLEGSRPIGIFGDRDSQDDAFTVALDTARLPRTVAAGATASVVITIDDADSDAAPSAAVTGLTATPKVRYLVLTWHKPSERATHYEIQYKTAAAPDQDATDQDPTTGWVWRLNRRYGTEDTTTRHITRLTAGTTYDIRVRAVNDTAPGPWATTQATPCERLTRGRCP